MTSKEAFDKVKGFILELRDTKYIEYKKYTDILNDLVERDTPMKPIIDKDGSGYCPMCNKIIWKHYLHKDKSFCNRCGQRLDWGK